METEAGSNGSAGHIKSKGTERKPSSLPDCRVKNPEKKTRLLPLRTGRRRDARVRQDWGSGDASCWRRTKT